MSLTAWSILSIFIAIFGYGIFDAYLIKKSGKLESISAYIIRGKKEFFSLYIVLACLFGFLCGHLFWSMDTFDYLPKNELLIKCEKLKDIK